MRVGGLLFVELFLLGGLSAVCRRSEGRHCRPSAGAPDVQTMSHCHRRP